MGVGALEVPRETMEDNGGKRFYYMYALERCVSGGLPC